MLRISFTLISFLTTFFFFNVIQAAEHKLDEIEKQETLNILRHRPLYFAYGQKISKIQFSFKAPLVQEIPVYFAYTQLMFWQLNKDSKPFLDLTHNPELFYRFQPIRFNEQLSVRSIDFGFWSHHSNGKDKLDSRSYDQSYIRLTSAFEDSSLVSEASLRYNFNYNVDEQNADINDFLSPYELELKIIELFPFKIDKSEWNIRLHPGGSYGQDWTRSGTEITFSFRLGGLKIVPSAYLQYYSGYGETLVNYNQRSDEIRIGFIF